MENIKSLMGSAYHEGVTIEEVNSFLSGKKLVNLNEGNYVAKDKYERVESEKKQLESDMATLKEATKDYDTLKSENEGYRVEKETIALKSKLSKLGINEKFFNYVKMDIDNKSLELGEDDKVNKTNVEKYLKEHQEFAVAKGPAQRSVIIGTNLPKSDDDGKRANTNSFINNGIRQAAGKKLNIEENVE